MDREHKDRISRRYEEGERVLWSPPRHGVIAEGIICEPDKGKRPVVRVTKVLSSLPKHKHIKPGRYPIDRKNVIPAPAEVVESLEVPEVVED